MPRPGRPLPDPALVTLATRIQASLNLRGLSLADPDTAQVYRAALESVRPILDGALATGILDAEQHTTLAGMYDAAALVPEVV